MNENFSSFHKNYNDKESTKAGSNRAFGFTDGGTLLLISVIKTLVAGAIVPIASLIFVAGAVLLFFWSCCTIALVKA